MSPETAGERDQFAVLDVMYIYSFGVLLNQRLRGPKLPPDPDRPDDDSCPARKSDSAGDLHVFRPSGRVCVFVDQAAQDSFSADLLAVDVGHRGRGSVKFVVGDTLRYALVRRAVL